MEMPSGTRRIEKSVAKNTDSELVNKRPKRYYNGLQVPRYIAEITNRLSLRSAQAIERFSCRNSQSTDTRLFFLHNLKCICRAQYSGTKTMVRFVGL